VKYPYIGFHSLNNSNPPKGEFTMKRSLSLVLGILLLSSIISDVVFCQIPRTISYQGVLANPDGSLIKDGNHQLVLTLYPGASGGAALYTEVQTVPVVRGLFNVIIGTVTVLPSTLTFDRAYFLGVSVDGATELSPRTAMTAVPYALYAEHAGIADGLSTKATGVVTSINEQSGSVHLLGAGGTTISNTGNTFTITSTTTGGGGFKLPYSDSAANGSKPIFNVGNTGATGNTISGIAVHGSGLTAMTTSAIFGDAGVGYSGVTGYSNGGSSQVAGVLGKGAGTTSGVIATADVGDALSALSQTGRAGSFQITNAASSANAIETSTTGTGEALRATAPGVGVHGLSSGSVGVLGETQSSSGIGVNARYSGTGVGTALDMYNGALRVSGAVRAAFIHTTTSSNLWGLYHGNSEIDNPLCNGDSTALVYIARILAPQALEPTPSQITSWWYIVYYNTTRQRWEINTMAAGGIAVGEAFHVWVVKR
jgi:hypothetical protein